MTRRVSKFLTKVSRGALGISSQNRRALPREHCKDFDPGCKSEASQLLLQGILSDGVRIGVRKRWCPKHKKVQVGSATSIDSSSQELGLCGESLGTQTKQHGAACPFCRECALNNFAPHITPYAWRRCGGVTSVNRGHVSSSSKGQRALEQKSHWAFTALFTRRKRRLKQKKEVGDTSWIARGIVSGKWAVERHN